jgi:(1->4)-alpha-D-glucan 1-alpha-D-glucosylmutase
VPDVYQGHEIINLSLVDPDNRQPVDYDALSRTLSALEKMAPDQAGTLAATPHDGRAKLWITVRLLTLRRERPALFRDGDYSGLDALGTHAPHVVAFARHHEGTTLVLIAGRLFARLLGDSAKPPVGESVWGDTAVAVDLPDGTLLTSVLTGESLRVEGGHVRLAAAFATFPGAALISSH